jgi:NAD-specific glutamate dehydrogenase
MLSKDGIIKVIDYTFMSKKIIFTTNKYSSKNGKLSDLWSIIMSMEEIFTNLKNSEKFIETLKELKSYHGTKEDYSGLKELSFYKEFEKQGGQSFSERILKEFMSEEKMNEAVIKSLKKRKSKSLKKRKSKSLKKRKSKSLKRRLSIF